MKQLMLMAATAVLALLAAGCGQTYEETKRLSREQRLQLWRADSAALKVAVMPTLDCLPAFVAQERGWFDTLGVSVRLKTYTAQMDCDTAVQRGRVEGLFSDLVRTERMQAQTPLDYVAATNAGWQLVTDRMARIRELKGLDDKMVAMTRYSATDLLADYVVDSVKLPTERVFRIQVNDVNVRLQMLRNHVMNALFLAEPQATAARMEKHPVLLDSRQTGWRPGVLAFRADAMKSDARQQQLRLFLRAYDAACDSLNKLGVAAYADIVARCCQVEPEVVAQLPRELRFPRAEAPRQADTERARQWLKGK